MNQSIDNEIQDSSDIVINRSHNQGDSGGVALFVSKNFTTEVISQMSYQFGYLISYIFQGVFYPLFFIVYNTFFNLTIRGKENLKKIKEPVIFISNHISAYDSFIFDLFVRPFSRITPFRFIGTTKVTPWYLRILKYTGVLYIIYLLFGVIKVTYGKGAEIATLPASEIINKGGTVAIFPEGKIWTENIESEPIGPFKWGAAILARNTGALVIPVAFRRGKKGLIRKKLFVNIGKPYRINNYERPEKVTDVMRSSVVELYGNK